jgi:hypothetical protein
MALRFADGFDQYDTKDLTGWWTQVYHGSRGAAGDLPAVQPGSGRRGGQCVRWDNNVASPLGRVIPDVVGTTAIVGFAFRGTTGASGRSGWGGISRLEHGNLNPTAEYYIWTPPQNFIVAIRHQGYTQIALVLNPNGTLSVSTGDALPPTEGGVLDTSVDYPSYTLGATLEALHYDEWHYIELKVIAAESGAVEVRIDGDVWLSLTSVDTRARHDGVAGWDEIVIGRNLAEQGGRSGAWLYDDLYVLDGDTSDPINTLADFLGDVAVSWVPPIADGDLNHWTPSSGGSRYAMVDEIPPDDDTTYIQSATPGHINTFQSGPLPMLVDVVAMGVMYAARRTEGGPSATRPVIRDGGVTYELGAPKGNTTSYSYQAAFFNKQPSDLSPITQAEFEAMQPGVKKVT